MGDSTGPPAARRRARWVLWGAFAVLWAAALLTLYPVRARDAVLPGFVSTVAGKGLHVAAYAVFAVLTSRLPVSRPRRWILLGAVSLHAVGTEFFQQFVGRTRSWQDVAIDHLGIALGVALTWRRWAPVSDSPRRP